MRLDTICKPMRCNCIKTCETCGDTIHTSRLEKPTEAQNKQAVPSHQAAAYVPYFRHVTVRAARTQIGDYCTQQHEKCHSANTYAQAAKSHTPCMYSTSKCTCRQLIPTTPCLIFPAPAPVPAPGRARAEAGTAHPTLPATCRQAAPDNTNPATSYVQHRCQLPTHPLAPHNTSDHINPISSEEVLPEADHHEGPGHHPAEAAQQVHAVPHRSKRVAEEQQRHDQLQHVGLVVHAVAQASLAKLLRDLAACAVRMTGRA